MHLLEITFARRLIWKKLHLAVFTFPQKLTYFPEFLLERNHIWPKPHFTEIFLRIFICQNLHLAEITIHQKLFSRLYTFHNLHLAKITVPQIQYVFTKIYICQKLYLTEITFARISFQPQLHFLENSFFRIYILPKLHFPKNLHIFQNLDVRNYIEQK